MSTPSQGLIHFPGLKNIRGGEFTFSTGITPSTCVITMLPQKELDSKPGTLTITYGKTKLQFFNAAIDIASLTIDERGQEWSLRILDRRWKWKFGKIYGRYNFRKANGDIDKDSEKKPRDLAKLLFAAMKEEAPAAEQLTALDNDARPEFDWGAANPAQELANLCEQLGCRVVLGIDNKVWIRKNGEGKLLPAGGTAMNAGFGFKANLRPDELEIIGGPIRYQAMFLLEAVGIDVDGKIKPIGELSYKPATGWKGETPGAFDGVTKAYPKKLASLGLPVPLIEEDAIPELLLNEFALCRDLAVKSVWKMFRVKHLAEGGLTPKGFGAGVVKKLKQLLPIEDVLVDTFIETDNNTKRSQPAYLSGVFQTSELGENSRPFTVYPGSFSVDGEKGIITSSDPISRILPGVDDGHDSPTLYLTTSFSVRDGSGALDRLSVVRALPGDKLDTPPRILHHPEMIRTIVTRYVSGKPVNVEKNDDALLKEARHYLDAIEKEYKVEPSTDVTYAGIEKIELDGAIQQVSWSCGLSQPATTRASRNVEHSTFVPSFTELRRREKAEAAAVVPALRVGFDLLRRLVTGKL